MLVRLKVKLAEMVNGLDLSHCVEGDVIEVSERDGTMLIAERWAEAVPPTDVTCQPKRAERAVAAHSGLRRERKGDHVSWKEHRFPVRPPRSPEHEP